MKNNKLTITMPIGMNFGWGICGRYLTKELANLCEVELFTEDFQLNDVGNDIEFGILNRLRTDRKLSDLSEDFSWPVLQAIQGLNLVPWYAKVKSPYHVGYTFFEKDVIKHDDISIAKDYFDIIVAGSNWCEKVLIDNGFLSTRTIIQGIDRTLFNPENNNKTQYADDFVIFSGGKLELRKSQDIIIRAFKIMQDKFHDVRLVNVWYNQWPQSIKPMQISPYIRFEMPKGDYFDAINHLLGINEIDISRVTTLPPLSQNRMANIYKNSDIGLFPNRCEGGTNLALMEYMACGKPVIASYSTGHKDILSDDNSIPIKELHPFKVQDEKGKMVYNWEEPNLDAIVSALEWAYWHRDALNAIGRTAGEDLSKLTWEKSAKQFYELIN